MTYNPKDAGNRIKALRVAAGMSQIDLSKRAGITQSAVSSYENGNYRLYPEVAIKLAAALDTTPEFLMALDTVSDIQPELA